MNLRRLRAERARLDAEVNVRLADLHLPEENIAQVLVVVLPRVDDHVLGAAVEKGDDAAQPDDLGTRAEPGHDLHRRSMNGASRLRSAAPSRFTSDDEYSLVSAGVNGSGSRSSGSIGRMT